MDDQVKKALDRMVEVPEDKAKHVHDLDIFAAHKARGKDQATLIPVTTVISFPSKGMELVDEFDRLMSLANLDPQVRINIYAYILKKELRFQIQNADDPGDET